MIFSVLNKESNILKTTFKGDIYPNEILDYINSFKDNTNYPRKLKSIIIATNTNFKFSFEDLKAINNAKIEALKNYDFVATSIIIDNSLTAAISTLYQDMAVNKKYKFKVFSTHKAALLWLDTF